MYGLLENRSSNEGLSPEAPAGRSRRPSSSRHSHACKRGRREFTALTTSDRIACIAITLSSTIMFIEACYIGDSDMRRFSDIAQMTFAFVFCAELAYRFHVKGQNFNEFFIHGRDASWNSCDLFLNFVSILDMLIDSWEGRFVHGLATVRFLRLFRLVRMFASNKFLRDLGAVLHTAGLQMMRFALVILLSLLILSVWATNMLWDFPSEEVAEAYGSLGASMWTLFKIMTMDGWIDNVEPVLVLHPSMIIFYGVFVFLSISSVSIVPAIFIEILIEDREKAKRKNARAKRKLRRRRGLARSVSQDLEIQRLYEAIQFDSDSSCLSNTSSDEEEERWRRKSRQQVQSQGSWTVHDDAPAALRSQPAVMRELSDVRKELRELVDEVMRAAILRPPASPQEASRGDFSVFPGACASSREAKTAQSSLPTEVARVGERSLPQIVLTKRLAQGDAPDLTAASCNDLPSSRAEEANLVDEHSPARFLTRRLAQGVASDLPVASCNGLPSSRAEEATLVGENSLAQVLTRRLAQGDAAELTSASCNGLPSSRAEEDTSWSQS